MNEDINYLWQKRHDCLYRAELSALYHRTRERFFDVCDRFAKAVAVIGGSAALANIGGPVAVQWLAAAITVTSTLSLVFGFGDRARRHSDLAAKFKAIESDILASGERDFTEANVNSWAERINSLEATEPATLSALVTICQNRIAVAQSHADAVVKVPAHQYLLAHFIEFAVEPKSAR